MAKKSLSKKTVKKTDKRKTSAKNSNAKKWVYLFEEVKAAEKYAGDWEGVRSLVNSSLVMRSFDTVNHIIEIMIKYFIQKQNIHPLI